MSREETNPVGWHSGDLVLNQCPDSAYGNTDTVTRADVEILNYIH